MILRLKSESGTLKCEFTEMENPKYQEEITDSIAYLNNDMFKSFESSFHPITLSEEAREYLIRTYVKKGMQENVSTQLYNEETECFEVKESDKDMAVLELRLKSVPVAENVPKLNYQTKCPTCNSPVTVGGDGTSQFYIPIEKSVAAGDEKLKHLVMMARTFVYANFTADELVKEFNKVFNLSQYKQNHSKVDWVSVTDNAPPLETPVLLYDKQFGIRMGFRYWNDGICWAHGDKKLYGTPTHWQPLPTPPNK